MMRVALICPNFLPCPPIKGGAIELLIDRSAPCLSNLGYSVTVFSIQDPSLANKETVDNVTFIRVPKSDYLKEVMRHMKHKSFDLIQVYNTPNWIAPLKEAFPKARVILSLHNMLLGVRYSNQDSRLAVELADRIVTVSKFLADDIMKRYPVASGKITPIYTGEDQDRYTPHHSEKGREIRKEMKRKLGIPKDYGVILFVGRLLYKKGCHHVIEAMRIIKEQHPKTALVIIGSKRFGNRTPDEYVSRLHEQANKITKHIYFTNLIPANKLADYYTMSDILVCPSQWEEPLARVQYEAMAAGIPVVTTKKGGNPEVVKHGRNGYVIEHYNQPKSFSRAILHLLKNEDLREKMGKTNRSLIETKYNIKNYAKQISEVYKLGNPK